MDIGTAIAVCGISFSAAAIVFKIVPDKKKCEADHCQDHSGVIKSIENIDSWLCKIDEKVTALLRNGKGQ